MQISCNTCGSSEIYLKKRGMQVGAYCRKCDKWIKWVGKKDLPLFTRKGFKIHEEGYSPIEHIGNSVPVQNEAWAGGVNTPPEYDEPYDFSYNYDNYEKPEDEDYYDEPPYAMGQLPEDISASNNCSVCKSGNIPTLGASKVMLRVFDNVLNVIDKDTGDIIATARLSRCPECGRKLG